MSSNTHESLGTQGPRNIHVLIIGAGFTGLILAQALRNHNLSQAHPSQTPHYTFSIYDRDAHAHSRGGGWSLTIHWALSDFRSLIHSSVMSRFDETLVNPEAADQGIAGNFHFFNIRDGIVKEKFPIPMGISSRVSREKLRKLLMEGLDVQWSKTLVGIHHPTSSTVTAQFSDGSVATGNLLVGCDGSHSKVRQILCPLTHNNFRLPVRLLGVSVVYPRAKCAKFRAIDPHFFQGSDPLTDAYLWFSFISLPREKDGEDNVVCQIMTSWPYRAGFLGRPEPTDVPEGNKARLAWMRTLSKDWAEPFRELVQDIPSGTEAKAITLEDWPPVKGRWDNHNGTVTLVGDAAHGMTMFRGEAANHGVIDVSSLTKLLLPKGPNRSTNISLAKAVSAYEEEMIERAHPAVLRSRQACLDAHNYEAVNAASPLIGRRAMKL